MTGEKKNKNKERFSIDVRGKLPLSVVDARDLRRTASTAARPCDQATFFWPLHLLTEQAFPIKGK